MALPHVTLFDAHALSSDVEIQLEIGMLVPPRTADELARKRHPQPDTGRDVSAGDTLALFEEAAAPVETEALQERLHRGSDRLGAHCREFVLETDRFGVRSGLPFR